jgi:hypothetical protein
MFVKPFQGWPPAGHRRDGHGGPWRYFRESMATPRVAEREEFREVIPRSYSLEIGPIEWKKKEKDKKRKRKKRRNQLKK